jgi:DNA polymerase
VVQARALAAAVDAAAQKMKAFVRFTTICEPDGTGTYVGWFEPAQRVTEAAAPFFARRYAGQPFALLTPDASVLWTGRALTFGPGCDPVDAPSGPALEAFWRAARGRLFPGAGLRNPPSALAIPQVEMVRPTPSEPSRRVARAAHRASRDAPFDGQAPTSLTEIEAGVQVCRRCDLWRDATQGVAGEGPGRAKLMLVGEQPGDQEDLAGHPFVGPAGQVLDKALAAAGVPRAETFVTNAVKHFKHEMRGKKRLHKTPNTGEVTACRWWLDAERRIVRPRVIVALGATAVVSVFGKALPIAKTRQQALQLPDQAQGVVTYHPSYLLRVPDAEAKAKAYAAFVEDLKFAWKLVA